MSALHITNVSVKGSYCPTFINWWGTFIFSIKIVDKNNSNGNLLGT